MDGEPIAESHEPATGPYSGKQISDAALLLLTGIALYLCWVLAKPFLAAITWAVALAVVAHPLHVRIERRLRPNTSAVLAVAIIVLVLLAPGAFLIQILLEEAGRALSLIRASLNSAGLGAAAERYPSLVNALGWLQVRFDLNQEAQRAAGMLAGQASSVVGGSVRFMTQIFIMLVTLFYFLRDRDRLLEFLRRLIPLSKNETDDLFARVSETISATLYGNLVVRLAQGILGGVMFWILGLSAPVLCGIAMGLFAIIPVVGASLIWGPAVIILLLQGSWVKAIVLAVFGALVISLMDNFLYPILVAGELRFHSLGVLFSVFGGLLTFGLAGVVLGPVILVSTVALLEVWRIRMGNDPSH